MNQPTRLADLVGRKNSAANVSGFGAWVGAARKRKFTPIPPVATFLQTRRADQKRREDKDSTNPMKILWKSLWKSYENPVEILWKWKSHENPMKIQWKSYENPMKILWKSYGNPMFVQFRDANLRQPETTGKSAKKKNIPKRKFHLNQPLILRSDLSVSGRVQV